MHPQVKGLNRMAAVFFPSIAPAILEAQAWSHFGLGKKKEEKKETSPCNPWLNAHLTK